MVWHGGVRESEKMGNVEVFLYHQLDSEINLDR